MGCGGSRVDHNHDEIPSKFKPILQQRLEEIRSKRTDDTVNGLSTKELLIEDAKIDNEERDLNKVTSSNIDQTFHVTQDCPPTLQKISLNTSSKLSQGQEFESEINISDDGEEGKIARKRQMSQGSMDDEIDLDEYDPSELRYGSPSFKVYCSEVTYEKDNDNFDDEVTVEGQRNSIGQESTCSNDVSVKQIPTKKEKRGRKFKLMMPNGGKFLHNMHSLYSFPCSSHSHAHLLQKAPS